MVKKTANDTGAADEVADNFVAAKYTGTNPHIQNMRGVARYDDAQHSWLFRAKGYVRRGLTNEWIRVSYDNLQLTATGSDT